MTTARPWPARCTAPGCEEAPVRLVQPQPGDEPPEVYEVDAFTDAVGDALATSARARLTANGWPVCDQHDRETAYVLPRWWAQTSDEVRAAARAADYWAELSPSADVLASLTHGGVALAGAYFPAVEPGPSFALGSIRADVLAALDAREDAEADKG